MTTNDEIWIDPAIGENINAPSPHRSAPVVHEIDLDGVATL